MDRRAPSAYHQEDSLMLSYVIKTSFFATTSMKIRYIGRLKRSPRPARPAPPRPAPPLIAPGISISDADELQQVVEALAAELAAAAPAAGGGVDETADAVTLETVRETLGAALDGEIRRAEGDDVRLSTCTMRTTTPKDLQVFCASNYLTLLLLSLHSAHAFVYASGSTSVLSCVLFQEEIELFLSGIGAAHTWIGTETWVSSANPQQRCTIFSGEGILRPRECVFPGLRGTLNTPEPKKNNNTGGIRQAGGGSFGGRLCDGARDLCERSLPAGRHRQAELRRRVVRHDRQVSEALARKYRVGKQPQEET